MRNKKSRYDLQSVLSTAGKLSCKRTALKHCTNIEIQEACLSNFARVQRNPPLKVIKEVAS